VKRVELGCPGHFIAVRSCHFRRHTQVGDYRVSTIGDYFPGYPKENSRETIGSGDKEFFETMVFKLTKAKIANNDGCGCREVADYGGILCKRHETAGEAQRYHEATVAKYARRK
jgi:hypothetical protein